MIRCPVGEDWKRRARAARRLRVTAARNDCAAFIELVLRHEKTGKPVRNAQFHRDWQGHLDENEYAVLIAPVEHAKTQQISVGRVLHELGKNPDIRTALISGSATLAKKPLKSVRQLIEREGPVHKVFPKLRPSELESDPWRDDQITVARSPHIAAKDPSVQALGPYGKINGSRLELIVIDDILTFENTRTKEQRNKLREWFDTEVFTRLTDGGRIYVIGTPWHPDDLLHVLGARPGFAMKRYSGVQNPNERPEKWIPLWPQAWSWQRLQKRRDNMVERDFVRKYLCLVRLDSTARFKSAWFMKCAMLGRGMTMLAEAPRMANGVEIPCFAGVDLGVGDKETDAETVITVLGLMPNGKRRPLEIEGGHWTAPEIVERLYSVYLRFHPDIYVESNGAQRFLIQFARMEAMAANVHHFHTGKNKWDPVWGVESLAVEFRNAQWVLPSDARGNLASPGLKSLVDGCLMFDPQSHTSDYLMSAWLARQALVDFSGERQQHVNMAAR